MRSCIKSAYAGSFGSPSNSLLPGDWDVSAAGGFVDLVHSGGGGVTVDSRTATAPRSRIRAMRH